jgi:hypothetical protein
MGTTNKELLMQTRTAADGMEATEPLAAPMVTLRDAHMKKLPHRRSFPRAKAPLDVVHMEMVRPARTIRRRMILMQKKKVEPRVQMEARSRAPRIRRSSR